MLEREAILEVGLYSRELLDRLDPWLARREAIVVLGPRRAGKTSLLKLVAQRFLREEEPVFFFDMEDPDDRDILSGGPRALQRFIGSSGMVVIDEFHLLPDPVPFVKLAVDHHPGLKLLLTGSSSLAFLKGFRDSLIGRTVEFHLFPLSFREFLVFKEQDRYSAFLEPGFSLFEPTLPTVTTIPEKLVSLFHEYLVFGGFPEVVLAREEDVKGKLLSQVFRLYALRDLKMLFVPREEGVFEKVFLALAGTTGGLVKYSELASEIGVSPKTVKRYVELLKALFIVQELLPYAPNPRREIKKLPKVYLTDTGLLSWALGGFSPLDRREQMAGVYVENAVFMYFVRNLLPHQRIRFWRKKDGAEVDFIVFSGNEVVPVEVKYRRHVKRITGMRAFLRSRSSSKGVVVTREAWGLEEVREKDVYYVPAMCLA